MIEEWRSIADFDGYDVSTHGRVRSWRTRARIGKRVRPWVLKPARQVGGYFMVHLQKDMRSHGRLVHRLVLEAFIGPQPDGFEASHLDGNPSHNAISNLQWMPHRENDAMKDLHGTRARGESHGRATLTENAVKIIRQSPQRYGIRPYLAKQFNVSIHVIADIRNGRSWKEVL